MKKKKQSNGLFWSSFFICMLFQFNQQLKRSEGGSSAAKIPKVEVTVSVDGVAIQEPKTKVHMFICFMLSIFSAKIYDLCYLFFLALSSLAYIDLNMHDSVVEPHAQCLPGNTIMPLSANISPVSIA